MSITSLNSLYDQILSKGSVLTSNIQSVAKTVDVWFELFVVNYSSIFRLGTTPIFQQIDNRGLIERNE